MKSHLWFLGLFAFAVGHGSFAASLPSGSSGACPVHLAESAKKTVFAKGSPLFDQRGAGTLLAVSSLPGKHAVGDFGSAYSFIDWMRAAKQTWWQVLPLNPADVSNSPFSSDSALALDVAYLDLQGLVFLDLLKSSESRNLEISETSRSNFAVARRVKQQALDLAYTRFQQGLNSKLARDFRKFRRKNAYWLTDHATFMVLKNQLGYDFTQWPDELRDRKYFSLQKFRWNHREAIARVEFEQFILDYQWGALKHYAHSRGIRIIGDMPLYMTRFSANVWANPEAFLLDSKKNPLFVSGYPPCSHYKNGQLWGTPVYDWEGLKRTRYQFWVDRVRRNLALYDAVRIDHFLGLHQFYAVDAAASTAKDGEWKPAHGTQMLQRLVKVFGEKLPLIAEDLGASVPEEVHAMRRAFGIPGMFIVQFGQGGESPDPYHHLSKYQPRGIAYTGNHDMPTLKQWLSSTKGLDSANAETWVNRLYESDANVAIVPVQDLLGLGEEGRMNEPGTWSTASDPNLRRDNWTWKLRREELTSEMATGLFQRVDQSKR